MPTEVATPGSLLAQPPGLEAAWTFNGLVMNDKAGVSSGDGTGLPVAISPDDQVNLFPNPSIEVSTLRIANNNGGSAETPSVTQSSNPAHVSSGAFAVLLSGTNPVGAGVRSKYMYESFTHPVVPGEVYYFRARVFGPTHGCQLFYFDQAGTARSGAAGGMTDRDTGQVYSGTGVLGARIVVPAGVTALRAGVQLINVPDGAAYAVAADAFMLVKGANNCVPYFDGDTPGYGWSGVRGSSASTPNANKSDTIHFTSIDGLQKLEFRDRREDKPSDHGELAYNSKLGGRTILISGEVQASNIEKMRDVLMSMRKALAVFTEKPLVGSRAYRPDRDVQIYCKPIDTSGLEDQESFEPKRKFQITLRASDPMFRSTTLKNYSQSFSVFDDFATSSLQNYFSDSGSMNYFGGQVGNTTAFRGYYNLVHRPLDARVTLKAVMPATIVAGDAFGLIVKRISATTYLYANVSFPSATTGQLNIFKVVSGSSTTLVSSSSFTVAPSTNYWIQASILANLVTVGLYSTDPSGGTGTSVGTPLTYTLAGGDATTFGNGVAGDVGIIYATSFASYYYDDFRIESLSINTAMIPAPVNAGIFNADTTIRVYGPASNVVITNTSILPDETVARSITINGAIPAGRYYEYSSVYGTLVDDLGANKFAQLDVTSKPIKLRSGTNTLTISGSAMSGITPRLDVLMQDTWI